MKFLAIFKILVYDILVDNIGIKWKEREKYEKSSCNNDITNDDSNMWI